MVNGPRRVQMHLLSLKTVLNLKIPNYLQDCRSSQEVMQKLVCEATASSSFSGWESRVKDIALSVVCSENVSGYILDYVPQKIIPRTEQRSTRALALVSTYHSALPPIHNTSRNKTSDTKQLQSIWQALFCDFVNVESKWKF